MLSGALPYSELTINQHTQYRVYNHEGQKMSDNKLDTMKQHGAFSWNELMTTDINAAKSFYQEMFNWKMHDMEMDEPYTMATINDQDVAGIMPMAPGQESMPAMWGGYVTVDNVEESVKQAQFLGGNVLLEPRDIPNVGRFSVIADPQGAPLSIISYFDQT